MNPDLLIRSMHATDELRPSDLAFAAECTAAEGWVSENLTTLEGFYQHDPQGCLIAELGGQPVGICVATPYGQSGFIGELIVRPEGRGQGIGAALLNHAVDYLHSRAAETVYLDGVLKAVGLYERNGFRKVCRSWRFTGRFESQPHPQVRPMQDADLPAVFALDQQSFGADRSFFLKRRLVLYPELCKVWEEKGELLGFIQGRRGEGWVSAGPWVVAPQLLARAGWVKRNLTGDKPARLEEGGSELFCLLENVTAEIGQLAVNVGVLDSHPLAAVLLRSRGFIERPDSPWRMACGPSDDLGAAPQCIAVGSAAKG